MNILVLSDNPEVLARAKPIFENRKVTRWTFTNSDDINPKKDFQHIIDTYELVFSLHCKKIFPKILTDSVRCINIHPGFNPYNRGIFPHVFSIVNGLPAGATIHLMTKVIDGGPIIGRLLVEVEPHDTSTTLYNQVVIAEMTLLESYLDEIIENNYPLSYYTEYGNYNSMDDFKKLCELTPDVAKQLRALSHDGYLNAHCGNLYFTLHTHTKNENLNTHTHTPHTD